MKRRGAILSLAGCLIAISANAYEAVPGQYVVELKDQTDMMMSTEMLSQQLDASVIDKVRENVVLVQKPVVLRAEYALQTLQSNPRVALAEPNFIYKIVKTPDDARYKDLWGMNNKGGNDPKGIRGVSGVDIGAEQAWDLNTGSKKVVVAVIDTGVDFSIPDLKDNAWVNEAEMNGKAGVDDDNNGYVDDIHGYNFVGNKGDSTDDHGHGSHCSGSIGAKGNDGAGVVGVNWEVSIMGVKFLSAEGSGTLADAVKSIDYARKNGAQIMSNSWGGGGYSKELEKAITDARDAGILFVAAAGNDSNNNDKSPSYPATYQIENVISVAAVNNQGMIAGFSNYGAKTVHLGAPGVNVLSTVPKGFDVYSGTSMATPHVSGVAALLKAQYPAWTYKEIKERLLATTKPLASLRNKTVTGGMVNAYLALSNQKAPPDANDPANWELSRAESISTPHPYKDKQTYTFKIQVKGAAKLAAHFAKFQTEAGYDKVVFKDAKGVVAGEASGDMTDAFSPVVEGDTMMIEMTTDTSYTDYGFDIDKVYYKSSAVQSLSRN